MVGQDAPADTPKPSSVNSDNLATAAQAQAGGIALDASDVAAGVNNVTEAAKKFWTEFEQAMQPDPGNKLTLKQLIAQDQEDLQVALAGGEPKHPVFLPGIVGAAEGEASVLRWVYTKLATPLTNAAGRLARFLPGERQALQGLDSPAVNPSIAQIEQKTVIGEQIGKLTADSEIHLSVSVANKLLDAGLHTDRVIDPHKVANLTEFEFLNLPGIGKSSLQEAKEWLTQYGLAFKSEIRDYPVRVGRRLQKMGLDTATPEEIAKIPKAEFLTSGFGQRSMQGLEDWLAKHGLGFEK